MSRPNCCCGFLQSGKDMPIIDGLIEKLLAVSTAKIGTLVRMEANEARAERISGLLLALQRAVACVARSSHARWSLRRCEPTRHCQCRGADPPDQHGVARSEEYLHAAEYAGACQGLATIQQCRTPEQSAAFRAREPQYSHLRARNACCYASNGRWSPLHRSTSAVTRTGSITTCCAFLRSVSSRAPKWLPDSPTSPRARRALPTHATQAPRVADVCVA